MRINVQLGSIPQFDSREKGEMRRRPRRPGETPDTFSNRDGRRRSAGDKHKEAPKESRILGLQYERQINGENEGRPQNILRGHDLTEEMACREQKITQNLFCSLGLR